MVTLSHQRKEFYNFTSNSLKYFSKKVKKEIFMTCKEEFLLSKQSSCAIICTPKKLQACTCNHMPFPRKPARCTFCRILQSRKVLPTTASSCIEETTCTYTPDLVPSVLGLG